MMRFTLNLWIRLKTLRVFLTGVGQCWELLPEASLVRGLRWDPQKLQPRERRRSSGREGASVCFWKKLPLHELLREEQEFVDRGRRCSRERAGQRRAPVEDGAGLGSGGGEEAGTGVWRPGKVLWAEATTSSKFCREAGWPSEGRQRGREEGSRERARSYIFLTRSSV